MARVLKRSHSFTCTPRNVKKVVPDDGDGYKGVDRDVHGDIEKKVPEFAGSVADEPVVGGVVVRHERHAGHDEYDVGHRQIQQQQVYGCPHLVSGQRHDDDEQVAEKTDKYDDREHRRRGDLVQDEVKQDVVFQVVVDEILRRWVVVGQVQPRLVRVEHLWLSSRYSSNLERHRFSAKSFRKVQKD